MTRLYGELADWWPVISPPSEYAEEAALYIDVIQGAAQRPVRGVLELGGGGNASHMKRAFALTLVEPAERMRELSRALNPECEHVAGDMRTVRLGRTFRVPPRRGDVYDHQGRPARGVLHRGGAALVAPDVTTETFAEATEHGGGADADGRRARYLRWTLPPATGRTSYETHYAFLLREPDGTVRVAHAIHREGLFGRETRLRLFREVGLTAKLVPRTIDGEEYDAFVAIRDPTRP